MCVATPVRVTRLRSTGARVHNGAMESAPLTGLGWPVSRETEPEDVSRETPLTGLGWPTQAPKAPPVRELP